METSSCVPEVVAWIGLDWADQRHEIRLAAASSTTVAMGANRNRWPIEQPPPAEVQGLQLQPWGPRRGRP